MSTNKPRTVAVLVGSRRKESLNRKLSQALAQRAAPSLKLEIVEIGRLPLVFLDVPVLQQPEAYIGSGEKLFGADGKLINEDTGKFLDKFLHAFSAWIEANAKN